MYFNLNILSKPDTTKNMLAQQCRSNEIQDQDFFKQDLYLNDLCKTSKTQENIDTCIYFFIFKIMKRSLYKYWNNFIIAVGNLCTAYNKALKVIL